MTRNELLASFAKQMRENLDASGRSGWQHEAPSWHFRRLLEEVAELHEAVERGDVEAVRLEAADVANFAMFVAGTIGRGLAR